MKIVLVSPLPPPEGGIATWTLKYKSYCDTHGIELAVVNNALSGRRASSITNERNILDEIGRTKRIIEELKGNIKSINPDIIHINSSCTTFGVFRDYLLVHIAKKANVKTIIHCRCNIEDQVKLILSKRAFSAMTRAADLTIVLNSLSYDYVRNISDKRVKRIPNFINEAQIVEEPIINENIKEILFVGHIKKTKGANEICEVAKLFPNYHFTLVGPIEDECTSLLWPNNTTLTGAKDASFVAERLKSSDVFLFPSYTEGFSNAIAEAMASGLPIIATDVGANKDMIEEGGGVIVPVGNIDSIVKALNKISNYNTRKRMSSWNVSKVKNYLVDNVMKELLEIYEEVIKG